MKHMILEDYKGLNNNTVLFGRSDSEKEKLTKYEILKSLDEGKNVIIVDFNQNYTEFCRLLGGKVIEIKDGLAINPLELFSFEQHSEKEEGCPNLAFKLLQVRNILTTLLHLTKEEQEEIWEPLVALYEGKGIVQHMKVKPTDFPTLEELAEVYPKKREEILQIAAHFSSGKSSYQHERYYHRRLTVLSFKETDKSIQAGVIHSYLNYYAFYLWNEDMKYRLFIDDVAPFAQKESFMNIIIRLVFNTRHQDVNGTQVNSSVFKDFYEYGGGRVLAFSNTQVILNLQENDIDSFCESMYIDNKERYYHLTKNSLHVALVYIGGYETDRRIYDELYEVEEIEKYLQKRKEINNLKTLQGKIIPKNFKFKNLFNKEYANLIDGYDIEYLLQHHLYEKEVKIEVVEKPKRKVSKRNHEKGLKNKNQINRKRRNR